MCSIWMTHFRCLPHRTIRLQVALLYYICIISIHTDHLIECCYFTRFELKIPSFPSMSQRIKSLSWLWYSGPIFFVQSVMRSCSLNSSQFGADKNDRCSISIPQLSVKTVLVYQIRIWQYERGWIMDPVATKFPLCHVFQAQLGYIFDSVAIFNHNLHIG